MSKDINIADSLGLTFNSEEFKLDSWGKTDFYCYSDDVLVLLEVEKTQKHPNTNVIKVWPYLEENQNLKILLIQVIRPENEASKNRIALAKYFGNQMEDRFNNRFRFVFSEQRFETAEELKNRAHKKLQELK